MAEIEIGPLSERLGEEEIAEIGRALKKAGAPKLPTGDDERIKVARNIDDDVLAEFQDHLEAHDIACDVYLPVEFDGRVEAADLRIGSLQTLVEVLELLKEELDISGDEDEEDYEDEDEGEEPYELDLIENQIKQVWKYFYDGATTALDHSLPMFVSEG